MSAYSRRHAPDRTPPRRLPRGTSVAAIAAAALMATLPAAAAAQAPEIPPAGVVVIAVMQSDGMALLPVGIATVPPLACATGANR